MLKGIIFDMDGVLVNSEPFHFEAWKETLKRHGIDMEYEVYRPCIGSTIGFLMDLLQEHYNISQNNENLVKEMKGIKEEIIKKQGYPPLIPYVRELLQRLFEAGYSISVASSSPLEYIERITEYWGIRKYFKYLVSGESVKKPKPAPDIFLKTASKMGFTSEECLVVEDSQNGCKAAKAAKMTCMAFYNPDSGNQDLSLADVIVEGFEEIDRSFVEKTYCHSHHLPAVVCETPRLFIREMKKEDIFYLSEIYAQKTSKAAWEDKGNSLIEGFESYRTYMYEMCDMGYWCVIKKDTSEIIGHIGIEPKFWNQDKSVIEFGYMIDENFRKCGFAYEACKAILKVAHEKGIVYLYCRIKAENVPSLNLVKKLGFEKIDYHLKEDSQDIEVWRYTCTES